MNCSESHPSMNACPNFSTTDQPAVAQGDYTRKVHFEEIAQLVPIALLITLANSLVLVLFAKRKQLCTPQNYVLFSLAVCDLITGVVNIPVFIIVVFTPTVVSPKTLFYLGILVGVLNSFTAISSCYHILVATTEKYLAIVRPVMHRMITKKTVTAVVIVVWCMSFIMAFVPFAWVNMEDFRTQAKLGLGHVIFCLIAVFLLPYTFMIYAFVVIFKSIANRGNKRESSPSEMTRQTSKQVVFVKLKTAARETSKQAALEKRCLILFATMATVFAVCWLPWFILMLLYRVYPDVESLEVPSHVFVLVRYATSIVNPLLYSFFRRDFRVALKSLFKCGSERSQHLPLVSATKSHYGEPAGNLIGEDETTPSSCKCLLSRKSSNKPRTASKEWKSANTSQTNV